MTRVRITVEMDIAPHTFVQTMGEAKALVEQILRNSPAFSSYNMAVAGSTNQHTAAETSGDELHNVFKARYE